MKSYCLKPAYDMSTYYVLVSVKSTEVTSYQVQVISKENDENSTTQLTAYKTCNDDSYMYYMLYMKLFPVLPKQ